MAHSPRKSEFERQQSQGQPSLLREFIDFAVTNKKWWLIPIFLISALLGLLAWVAGTGAAPFIYTIF